MYTLDMRMMSPFLEHHLLVVLRLKVSQRRAQIHLGCVFLYKINIYWFQFVYIVSTLLNIIFILIPEYINLLQIR